MTMGDVVSSHLDESRREMITGKRGVSPRQLETVSHTLEFRSGSSVHIHKRFHKLHFVFSFFNLQLCRVITDSCLSFMYFKQLITLFSLLSLAESANPAKQL